MSQAAFERWSVQVGGARTSSSLREKVQRVIAFPARASPRDMRRLLGSAITVMPSVKCCSVSACAAATLALRSCFAAARSAPHLAENSESNGILHPRALQSLEYYLNYATVSQKKQPRIALPEIASQHMACSCSSPSAVVEQLQLAIDKYH